MEVILIAAVAADGGIGCEGGLLWHLPADLKHFKQLTEGHPVIMGRNTWESLPKKPLPMRRNIIISRSLATNEPSGMDSIPADIFASLPECLAALADEERVYIIGGGQLYKAAMAYATGLELTEIEAVSEKTDTWFPEIDRSLWHLDSSEEHEENGLAYRFVTYSRTD